jgi:hypothetical protein
MDIRLTYIHHDSFVLGVGGRALLFDFPDGDHRPQEALQAMFSAVNDQELFVFISHGHGDHFDPALVDLLSDHPRVRFILSDDVAELFPQAVSEGALLVAPEVSHRLDDLTIETLPSNDLGVAFIISWQGLTIYFGGDLACWDWPNAHPAEQDFTRTFFTESLNRLVENGPVHIGFSNVDKRLASLAGGLEFVDTVRPGLFVPMHTFGDTSWLQDVAPRMARSGTEVFSYSQPGDSAVFNIQNLSNDTRR